jgi:glutamate decarboxylase
MTTNRESLADLLRAEDSLEVFDDDLPTLPLLILKTHDAEPFDSNDLVGELARRRGWLIPAYQMPPNNENDRIIRMLIKINQTRELADALADDFSASIKYLRAKSGGKTPGPPSHTGHRY